MKARIAFLEGEKRGIDNTKIDLMKRVKMLEYALRQERSKYVESKEGNAVSATSPTGVTQSNVNGVSGLISHNKAQNRLSSYSNPSQNMSQVSPTSATPGLDPIGRAKSREFLRICLQEISYLTATVPQSIAMAMPPAPTRLARAESDRRAAAVAAGGRNRKSDIFPSSQPSAVPPPLNRANSVPVTPFSGLKHSSNSPPLDPPVTDIAGGVVEDRIEDATLKQFASKQQQHHQQQQRSLAEQPPVTTKPAPKPVPHVNTSLNNGKQNTGTKDTEKNNEKDEEQDCELDDTDEEPVTVLHSPISGDWHAKLQKAGQDLAQQAKAKKKNKPEDEAQLSKDVQDKFKISTERLNKMVKDWDKSKQDGVVCQKSIRQKKGKESGNVLDDLASLSISEAEFTETGSKDNESLPDEAPRWRPRVTLKRHLDTVRSIAFHPNNKSIISGSEDGTMRYWNLESSLKDTRRAPNGEVEPIHTYRGHTKGITSVAISADQNKCFSGSMDSTIRSYRLAPMDKETYAPL
ncbi:hypothetical protein BGZ46_002662, partial [Entomortierella lignicola]